MLYRLPLKLSTQIVQILGGRLDARDKQVVSRSRTCHIQQLAFSVVDLLQVGVVTNGLDSLLQGDYLVVASHDSHGAELQPLG
jgi:hypothetical protein